MLHNKNASETRNGRLLIDSSWVDNDGMVDY